jgi:Calx-beta domain/Secretion system C-terminal sorting domain/Ricin-type beta-trefoil lectin domain-like/HYR domain
VFHRFDFYIIYSKLSAMLKTYVHSQESWQATMQRLFLTILVIVGLGQSVSATCTINGGTIGNPQTGCGSLNPSAITNVTSVSSPYGGPFAYIWLATTDQNAVNGTNQNWTVVAGATAATYDPGVISTTTWYRRCARRVVHECPNYDGESNWIKMTVNAAPNATITANTTITQGQSVTLNATGGGTYAWSTGATTASISVAPSATTTYSVTVTNNGCTAVRSTVVTVNAATGVLTFNCQANLSATAAAGATTAVVTYPNQTATSTCAIGTVSVTRVSGPASGSAFPVGTTQVCYRATDGCGQTKDCCFNVVVTAGAPAADCNNIGIVAANGSITVNGVSGAPIVSIQIFDASWATVYNQYFTNSPGTVNIPSLAAGSYYVKVQYLTSSWTEICKKEQSVTVAGAPVTPSVSISDITVNENAGTASLQICASAASTSPVTVTYTTSNGSAMMGSDYTTTTATATIPAGQTCTTVTFPITDDATNEPTESFNVTLSGPNGATIADGSGSVTILDNDNAPVGGGDCNTATLTAGTGSIIAGNLSNPGGITIIQAYDANWNQVFNQYYTTTPASVTIPNLAGGNYWVKVQYLTSAWVEICKKETTVTVGGAPSSPVLTISDVTVNENAGTASLQICASAASTSPITVTYTTQPNTAVAGGDYTAKTATATIPAGQTCVTVTFNITDDATNEPTEVFHVYLSGAVGATIGDLEGLITILDNDNAPVGGGDCATATFTAGNGSITLGNLSNPGGITMIQAFDSNWNTVFNQYYTTTPASVTIPNLAGGNYWTKVQYLTSAWVEICKKEMTVTVAGAPTAPTVSISDVTVNENAGTASLQICASAASSTPITVAYATSNGSALAGSDYTTTSATATIPAGQTCVTVTFPILDNTTQEPIESFNVTLSGPNGATIADGTGTVTITDNDNAPAFDCTTASVVAGTGSIVVSNLANAPIIIVQVADPSWNQTFNQYYTTNPGTVTIPATVSGTYYVKVQYLNADWTELCKKESYIAIVGAPVGVLTFPQPGNVTLTAAQGATSAVVTYPNPTATSTCTTGSVSVVRVSGPASGSSFPVGTTAVCYRATDGCGNTQDRCFNVIVNAPAGPVCNVTRTATNNSLRNNDCSVNGEGYGVWFNVHIPGTTSNRYSLQGTTFTENADGTANLTGTAVNNQNANYKFAVNVNFCGRTYAAPAGSPKAPCYAANTNGWYYYTTVCGTLTGQTSASGLNLAITRRGEAFQVGTGANLNENVFGASGWFNIFVTSGAAAGLVDGDFNFNLSGNATAPACGTGTANCSTVACYTPAAGGFPNTSLCYRVVNKEVGTAIDADNHPSTTARPVDNSSSQAWKFVASNEANFFYIVSQSTSFNGQAIGMQNCSAADGATSHIGALQYSDCQKFRLQDAGSGFYYIVNKVSGKGLKLGGSNIWADGAPLIQLPIDVNNQHQKWKLETVTCSYAAVAQTAVVNLSANRSGNEVTLRWVSNTGTQNASYAVERSLDGKIFEVIATASATSLDESVIYNDVDNTPAKATNIYRVRMILKDGTERVSNEQNVFMPEVGAFGLYPNPAAERVTLDASDFAGQNVSIQLFNQLGKLVQTLEVSGTNGLIEMELSNLNSGFYGVSIESNGVKRTAKLVVTKN